MRPNNLLIYYGWLNAFNSSQHGWNNEKVAQELAKYDLLVFGNGLQDSGHGDYSNTEIIIPRIKALNPGALIFGYVTVNQGLSPFQTKVNEWDTLQVHGIFMDEAGYDYGKTRDEFNSRITHVKSKIYCTLCFANAWNMDHIIGITNDPSYPNATYNVDIHQSNLEAEDWYLLESFSVNTTAYSGNAGYATKADWIARANKACQHRVDYGLLLASVGIINNDNSSGESLFSFSHLSSLMFELDAHGTSDTSYGASSAAVNFWTQDRKKGFNGFGGKPIAELDVGDADVYHRYGRYAKISIDHSTSAQGGSIIKW